MGFLTLLFTICSVTMRGCLFAAEVTQNTTLTIKDPSPGCSEMEGQNLTAYLGWPSVLSFKDIVSQIQATNLPRLLKLHESTAFCIVRLPSTGQVLHNVSLVSDPDNILADVEDCAYQLFDISHGTPATYILEFKLDDLCEFQKVHIIKENQPVVSQNCSNAVTSSEFGAIKGTPFTLTCGGGNLDSLTLATNITYKWIYMCDKQVDQSIRRDGNKLEFKNTSFSLMGQYLCIVQYKGQQLPAVKFDVCVEHGFVPYNHIELKCTVPTARLGGDVTINCGAAVGETKVSFHNTGSKWYKGGIEICKDSSMKTFISNKYLCSRESSLDRVPCYKTLPVLEAQIDFYNVNLTIKNVTRSDLGKYQLYFKWGSGRRKTQINVTLEEDLTVLLKNQIIGISIGVVIVILIILCLLFCLFHKNDVAWFVKKHFGPYEAESLSYTAYFVYYYDSTDKASDEMTTMKKLVEGLHEFMNKFGGTVYDEQRDPNIVAGDADNIKLVAGDCHRIIVMISPGFVKDKWSCYKTDTALTEAVETGRKVIFITIPGAKDAIQNLSEEPRTTLQSAIKRNVTVEWNGKIPFNGSFRRRMEYGLPKLQKTHYSRWLSDSSQIPLNYQNIEAKNYDAEENKHHSNECDFVA